MTHEDQIHLITILLIMAGAGQPRFFPRTEDAEAIYAGSVTFVMDEIAFAVEMSRRGHFS